MPSSLPPVDQPWRIGVVGPGALGCLFAGLLALAGHDVRLLGRRPEQTEALTRDGVVVERNGEARRAAVQASINPAALGPVDLAIVLVKATDTTEAEMMAPRMFGMTTLVSTCNQDDPRLRAASASVTMSMAPSPASIAR